MQLIPFGSSYRPQKEREMSSLHNNAEVCDSHIIRGKSFLTQHHETPSASGGSTCLVNGVEWS